MERMTRLLKLAALPAFALVAGCGAAEDGSWNTEEEPLTELEQGLSLGAERRIPVRFIHVYDNTKAQPAINLESLRSHLAVAQETFRPAGIELEFYGLEEYAVDPALVSNRLVSGARLAPTDPRFSVTAAQFNTLASQLGAPVDTNLPAQSLGKWMGKYQASSASNRSQLVVFVSGIGNNGTYPWHGSNTVYLTRGTANGTGDPIKLAHEIGHAFGLKHTFKIPKTCDWYRLVYGKSQINTYFEGREDCETYRASGGSLERLDPRGVSGSGRSVNNGVITFGIGRADGGRDNFSPGSWQIDGLGRNLGSGTAINVMMYFEEAAREIRSLRGVLSPCQIEVMRKQFRENDRRALSQRALAGRVPTHSLLSNVDFDGDGKRDFATWTPPEDGCSGGSCETGIFATFESSNGYQLSRSAGLGILNDIPLVADFDADGKADLGVFRRGYMREDMANENTDASGPGIGFLIFCSSRQSWNCSKRRVVGLGGLRRGDIPIAGTHFLSAGTKTRELLVISPHHPSGARWRVFELPATYQRDTGFPWNRWAGYLSPRSDYDFYLGTGTSHFMPDLWDGDGLTDAVVYNPETAKIQLRRSQWYDYKRITTRSLGSEFIPRDTGSSADRQGVLPVPQYRRYWNGSKNVRRRTFAMWESSSPSSASQGRWISKWAWWSTSAPQVCTFGSSTDVPIGGIGSGSLDSDFATFTPEEDWHSTLRIKQSARSNCSGGVSSQTIYNYQGDHYSNNLQFVAVHDMYGDGDPELLQINPYGTGVKVYDSASNYQSATTLFTLGQQAHLL